MYIIFKEDRLLKDIELSWKNYEPFTSFENLYTFDEALNEMINILGDQNHVAVDYNFKNFKNYNQINDYLILNDVIKINKIIMKENYHIINIDLDIGGTMSKFKPNILDSRFNKLVRNKITELKIIQREYIIDSILD